MRNIIHKLRSQKILIAIVVLSAVVRFIGLSDVPPALNWDEISHGYNAYSILKTGKDEWGEMLPLLFRAYGDYKLPGYIYVVVPSIALFGLTEFAVRLPSALAGIGSVVFTYLLVEELLSLAITKKSEKHESFFTAYGSLLTAFLMAIEPWSLFLSRGAFEANLAQFFVISGVYFFLRGLRSAHYLPLAITTLGLSVWTYNSARIFVPFLLVSLILLFRNELKHMLSSYRRIIVYFVFLAVFFFVPMFVQLANPEGSARYSKVQILDEGEINRINEGRNTSSLPSLLPKLVHNKATYFARAFLINYSSHFSPRYLFFEGGDQYQFSVPGHGLMYLVTVPFFYFGLYLVIRNSFSRKNTHSLNRKRWKLILLWLLLAPIPSSLTREAPHVLRSITFLPIPMFISAYGLTKIINWSHNNLGKTLNNMRGFRPNRKKALYFAYLVFILLSLESYLTNMFNEYRETYSWSWQYGYKEAVSYARENYSEYDKIIVTKKYGEPHEFFLFYNAWNPESFRNDKNLIRFEQSEWFWVDGFDKYYFVNDWQVDEVGTGNFTFNLESKGMVQCTPKMFDCLLITSPGNVPDGWELLHTITFLDAGTAFEIYEN